MSQRVWSQVEKVIEDVMLGKKSPYEYIPAVGITPDRIRNQMVTDTYDYTVLASGPKAVRLLELLPGTRQGDIACILTGCTLDSRSRTYDALSYVWGDTTELTPIQVNGRTLMVTANLRTALLSIRKPDQACTLWIDALCIDQVNILERNHQVSIMADIYRNATRTVVWLGDSRPPLTEMAYAMVDELAAEAIARQHTGADTDLNYLSLPLLDVEHVESPLFDRFRDDFSAMHLACAGWWHRTWTVQEVLLASQAVVMAGTFTMDWDRFCRGVDYGLAIGIWNPVMLGIMVDPIVTPYLSMRALRKQKRRILQPAFSPPSITTPAQALLDLLIQCRFRQASDPRDKIYALLGMLQDVHLTGPASTLGIEPDYSLSTSQVYLHTARQLLLHSENLDLLGASTPAHTTVSLPSWAPDWSTTTPVPRPLMHDARGRPRQTHASLNLPSTPRFLPDSPTTLPLTGHPLTTITRLSPVLHRLQRDSANFQVIKRGDTLATRLASLGHLFAGLMHIYTELSSVVPHLATFGDWETFARASPALPPSQTTPDPDSGAGGYDPLAVYWQTLCVGTLAPGTGPSRDATAQLFYRWWASLSAIFTLRRWKADSFLRPLAFVGYLARTWRGYSKFACLLEGVYERRLGRGEDGCLVLLPGEARVGDRVVVVKGGRVPLVVRGDGRGWVFVGEAYVQWFMDGEGFEEGRCEEMRVG